MSFSVVIIAENEASNIGSAVSSSCAFSNDVWVLDGGSDDDTAAIAASHGARVTQHAFESWGQQRNHALDTLPLRNQYVLFLDADERLTEGAAAELNRVAHLKQCAAVEVNFDIIFLGRVLRWAHENPPIVRAVRRGDARWLSEGAREYCRVTGAVGRVAAHLIHEDRKGVFFWTLKHIRNAEREAALIARLESLSGGDSGVVLERSWRLKMRRIYEMLPPFGRPIALFLYRYVMRGGFMDGAPGLVFCVFQALWYNLLISARVAEMHLGHDCYLPPYGTGLVRRISRGPKALEMSEREATAKNSLESLTEER